VSNLVLLKKQHIEIFDLLATTDTLIAKSVDDNIKDIANNINSLSGKLKMHLMSEDEFLYPTLMQSSNKVVRDTAWAFNEEMGGLAATMNAFVQNFNTPQKILQDGNSFRIESRKIFRAVRDRINREDAGLFTLME